MGKILKKSLWKSKKMHGKLMNMIGTEIGATVEEVELNQLNLLNKRTPVVYMVFDDKMNMYVGQTCSMTDRFYQHRNCIKSKKRGEDDWYAKARK